MQGDTGRWSTGGRCVSARREKRRQEFNLVVANLSPSVFRLRNQLNFLPLFLVPSGSNPGGPTSKPLFSFGLGCGILVAKLSPSGFGPNPCASRPISTVQGLEAPRSTKEEEGHLRMFAIEMKPMRVAYESAIGIVLKAQAED